MFWMILIIWWKKLSAPLTLPLALPLIIMITWQETLTAYHSGSVSAAEYCYYFRSMIIVHQIVHSKPLSSGQCQSSKFSKLASVDFPQIQCNCLRELEDVPQMQLAIAKKKLTVIRTILFSGFWQEPSLDSEGVWTITLLFIGRSVTPKRTKMTFPRRNQERTGWLAQ